MMKDGVERQPSFVDDATLLPMHFDMTQNPNRFLSAYAFSRRTIPAFPHEWYKTHHSAKCCMHHRRRSAADTFEVMQSKIVRAIGR
jgi:hypothetical protein